jgi:hypothetical protein
MKNPRKSPTAARELGVSYHQLAGLLRSRKIPPPQKDSSGDYIWTDEDLDRARQALAVDLRRKRQPITAS